MRIVMLTANAVSTAGSVTGEYIQLLRKWGVQVEIVLPETLVDLTSLDVTANLYLLKSVNDHVVGVATALEAAGAQCLNRADVVRLCRDRVAVTGVLAAAGVPVPQSWTTTELPALEPLLAEGPVIIKTSNDRPEVGHRVVWNAEDLVETSMHGQQWLVQRLEPTESRDRKVYRIGDQVFGVKRRWPAVTLADKSGEPFTVTTEHRQICDATAQALGTDLFGLDLVEGPEGPVVVDVHPFPGFKGVPNGALRLADYIYATLREEAS